MTPSGRSIRGRGAAAISFGGSAGGRAAGRAEESRRKTGVSHGTAEEEERRLLGS
jgi:hypothetical protein